MSVFIAGIGKSAIAPALDERTYRELLFDAVLAALADAGLQHTDIESAMTASEDLVGGRSIADEFTTDALAARLKPNDRVCGDSLHCVIQAAMQIEAGLFDVVVVGAESKGSESRVDCLDRMSLDPLYEQPVVLHGDAVAGMECRSWLHRSGNTRESTARVVVKNRLAGTGLGFGGTVTTGQVLAAPVRSTPITSLERAPFVDGATAMLMVSERKAKELAARRGRPLVRLAGWGFLSGSSWNSAHEDGPEAAVRGAGAKAFRDAGIPADGAGLDLAELDDRFAHRELLALEALGLARKGHSGADLEAGRFEAEGALPVNPSGGRLGGGDLFTGAGLRAAVETVGALRALRGEALPTGSSEGLRRLVQARGGRTGTRRGVVQSLFGVAASTAVVTVLELD